MLRLIEALVEGDVRDFFQLDGRLFEVGMLKNLNKNLSNMDLISGKNAKVIDDTRFVNHEFLSSSHLGISSELIQRYSNTVI